MAKITLSEHERILDAIEAGDIAAAQEAMRLHLAGAAERVGLKDESSRARRARSGAPQPAKDIELRAPKGRTKTSLNADKV